MESSPQSASVYFSERIAWLPISGGKRERRGKKRMNRRQTTVDRTNYIVLASQQAEEISSLLVM
jgi:hypothetical protein